MNKISIIVPLYNKEKTISRTIKSVINQSSANWELIIVDDGSTDRSYDKIAPYLNNQILYFKKKNSGVSSTRNYGVNLAHYSWILFLDADDVLYPSTIETFCKLISQHNDLKIFIGNFDIRYPNKKVKYTYFNHDTVPQNNFKYLALGKLYCRPGNTVAHKSILLKYPYDERLVRYEDFEPWLRILKDNKVYLSKKVVMSYELDFASGSSNLQNFSKDYLSMLNIEKTTPFWEKVVQYQLYNEGVNCYGVTVMNDCYGDLFNSHVMMAISKLFIFIREVTRYIGRNFIK